jgi:hypothetical protein
MLFNTEITDTDLERFTERVTKAHEEHIETATQNFARMRAQSANRRGVADIEVEWTKAIREGFELSGSESRVPVAPNGELQVMTCQ